MTEMVRRKCSRRNAIIGGKGTLTKNKNKNNKNENSLNTL